MAQRAERSTWGLLAAGIALVSLLLYGERGDQGTGAGAADLTDVLPGALPSCRLSGEAAGARAEELDAAGHAQWERAPFDASDLPRAVLSWAEAQSCYEAAGLREGAQRSNLQRRVAEAELARRWARARLITERARRAHDAPRARKGIREQLSLSSGTGPRAAAYRERLRAWERALEDSLRERSSNQR